ncbi:MAG: hypothetical protein ACR2QT_03510 [Woeseiaceae bacterium]
MIKKDTLPDVALLQEYVRKGAYTDCYSTEIDRSVALAEYVTAFYTTWLFKLERLILRWAVARPSTDEQVRQLVDGELDVFSAWSVEGRSENQLLMCDFQSRTRSWFMVLDTQLYFGSAVIPVRDPETGEKSLRPTYKALLGFHRLYSRALLYCAKSRLQ